jgi:hypothetical protein
LQSGGSGTPLHVSVVVVAVTVDEVALVVVVAVIVVVFDLHPQSMSPVFFTMVFMFVSHVISNLEPSTSPLAVHESLLSSPANVQK